jgi:hypothetical protein
MEPTTGIEPVNLFLTKEVLCQLSYVGMRYIHRLSDIGYQKKNACVDIISSISKFSVFA